MVKLSRIVKVSMRLGHKNRHMTKHAMRQGAFVLMPKLSTVLLYTNRSKTVLTDVGMCQWKRPKSRFGRPHTGGETAHAI
jgi:hypothetical protein